MRNPEGIGSSPSQNRATSRPILCHGVRTKAQIATFVTGLSGKHHTALSALTKFCIGSVALIRAP